ncbi:MAG: carboxypeptidase regulatory-like domain-containing protein [Elusimicrobia bacterium]|nr:carboxypeptidase regulatory-like domain-containing protein [Elusimicrobiota bacterium]
MSKNIKTKYLSGITGIRGLTLAEVMIAVAIVSIAFLALVSGFIYMTKALDVSRASSIANNIAQGKIEKIKNLDYYRIITTTSVPPNYYTEIDPPIPYDNGYFPPEEIEMRGLSFKTFTYIQSVVEKPDGSIEELPPGDDTGMKLITTTVVWGEEGNKKKIKLKNMVSNPDMVSTDALINGTVTDAATSLPITEAVVNVAENMGWTDITDSNGNYGLSVFRGSYFLTVSAIGYYTSNISVSITSGQTLDGIDVALSPMVSGSIMGMVWINDHPVISQVVMSTQTTPNPPVERYIELYNPTTYYYKIASGGVTMVDIVYQHIGEVDISSIALTYVVANSSIPPESYYLIASTPNLTVCNDITPADAYGDFTGVCGGYLKATSLGLRRRSDNKMLDIVGWNGTDGAPPWFEDTPVSDINLGLDTDEQFVRRTSPAPIFADGLGRAYDTDDNSVDFIREYPIIYGPKNTSEEETLVSGTPCYGAIVSANDGYSTPDTASEVTDYPTFSVFAGFELISSTGTWSVIFASGPCFFQVSGVVVTPGATTYIQNADTDPEWPEPNYYSVFLSSQTDDGFVSGRITDGNGNPIPSMTVSDGLTDYTVNGDGNYFIQTSTGLRTITANPDNDNKSYISLSSNVFIYSGQITSDINFVLPYGGQIKGFITMDGANALPGIAVVAIDEATEASHGQDVSNNDGIFTLINLSTGAYRIESIIDSGETSEPEFLTGDLDIGEVLHVGTFTITGAYGTVTGSLTYDDDPIGTGVLIMVTSEVLSDDPPALSSATLTEDARYCTSGLADGTYSLQVRGSTTTTYNVYGWYPTMTDGISYYSRQEYLGITVTAGQETPDINLAW